jgi:transketolase
MFAGHHKLDNLTVILDFNGYQLDDATSVIMDLEPVKEKWLASKWHVLEVGGHDMQAMLHALKQAKDNHGKPTVIIARTVKGKGISFMENNNKFHGSAPSPEELQQALQELEEERKSLI